MSKKIAVLMSGGVDSSVSALLLKNQGFKIVGIHLHCSDFCNPQDAEDARKVAQHLNIPFYVFDLTNEFEEKIIHYMIETYRKGLTPNPDVYCNQFIKFGIFLEKALGLGYDLVASGHYAQIKIDKNSHYYLAQAKDKNKDQTYFLWSIPQEKLSKLIFPVGNFLKEEVRKIAKENNLLIAEKKESMGICFVGQVKLKEFLSKYLNPKEGKIIDTEGKILGTHPGYFYFTEGQRHGLNIKIGGGPYYIAQKIPDKNLIVVAKENHPLLYSKRIEIINLNILEKNILTREKIIEVRFRHRQPLVKAKLFLTLTQPESAIVEFLEPQKMIAPGQSIVFYHQEYVLGGGIIFKKIE
jgi:tRNA-specific 2-thiouridylase